MKLPKITVQLHGLNDWWETEAVTSHCQHSWSNPNQLLCFCDQCKCWPGFHLKDDGKTCVDVDECSTTLPCSQRCINTYGSYKCLCVDGYEALERNPNTCKSLSGQPSFFHFYFHFADFSWVTGGPTRSLTLNGSHFSWRAFSYYGWPPWDPEIECWWFKLHNLEAGKCRWTALFYCNIFWNVDRVQDDWSAFSLWSFAKRLQQIFNHVIMLLSLCAWFKSLLHSVCLLYSAEVWLWMAGVWTQITKTCWLCLSAKHKK